MDVQQLRRRLEGFGLDGQEALLFYHLSRLGPSRAADVARAAGKQRTDAYRVLESLVAKGFLEKTLDRPTRFVPVPVEAGMARVLERRRVQLEQLGQSAPDIASHWPRPSEATGPGRQRYAVHQGAAQIQGLYARMVEAAQEDMLVAANGRALRLLARKGLLEAMQERARSGVLVRLLTNAKAGDRAMLDRLAEVFLVRHSSVSSHQQMVLVDGREMALWVNPGKALGGSGEECVLWFNAPGVVQGQKGLLDGLWAGAVSYQAWRRQLEGQGAAAQAGVLRGRWVRYDRMRAMIANAQHAIVIAAPNEESDRWGASGVAQALEERESEGITVVRHESDATWLVTDGQEALRVLRRDGEPVGLTHEEERSLWATEPDFVRLVLQEAPAPALRILAT